jgi:hypothetical protein
MCRLLATHWIICRTAPLTVLLALSLPAAIGLPNFVAYLTTAGSSHPYLAGLAVGVEGLVVEAEGDIGSGLGQVVYQSAFLAGHSCVEVAVGIQRDNSLGEEQSRSAGV